AEWQAAVIGTPDPGPDNGTTDCNTHSTLAATATGTRSSCKSSDGASDMVGNMREWSADWVPLSFRCGNWDGDVSPTGDAQCLSDAPEAPRLEPGALNRGGGFGDGTFAGPLMILGDSGPSASAFFNGFRCAR